MQRVAKFDLSPRVRCATLDRSAMAGWGHASYGGSFMAEKSGSEAGNWMVPLGLEAMMEMQRPTFTAMAEVNTKLYEGIAAANREWASFVNQRLKEDLAMPQQLAECRNVQDLFRVYAQFFQTACAQYQSGLEQMTKLSQSITDNALQTLQSRTEGPTKH
jgi:hypothetical protein